MISNYSKMRINDLKKILFKKGFKISKIRKNGVNEKLKNLYFTSITGFLMIGFFSLLPIVDNFISSTFYKKKVFENYSKKYLEKVLSGETLVSDENVDDVLNEKYLFDDVEFKEGPSKSVRIEASTLNEMFAEKNYQLKLVRKEKIVKPFEVGMLPEEMKKIESSKIRKDLFIKIVLPLILSENNIIKIDRKNLFKILNKSNNTQREKDWIEKKFKQYGVVNKDLSTLKVRMDVIPVSLALAQAAKETGWGTSRFAIEGNALFGQWTFSGNGIKPAAADEGTKHKVMTFSVLKASVRAYQRNLNTHSSYKEFRKARAIQRDNDENLNSLELVNFLNDYAENGEEYIKTLKKIIQQNNLKDFDNAKILPLSKELKSNI